MSSRALQVTINPLGAVLAVEPGESILEAALRLGYQCPKSCKNGNCHVCQAELTQGAVRQQQALHEQGLVLTCLAKPEQDCTLYWEGVLAPLQLPIRVIQCQVLECVELGADVVQVRLLAPAGRAPRYHAGQYVLIERDDGQQSAFSLASAPHHGRELELHILAREDGAIALLNQLKRDGMAKVQLPFGKTHLAVLPNNPLVLIGAGTGMAQMHSLLSHCLAQGFKHALHVYWGARTAADLYQINAWNIWQQLPNVTLHQVISDDPAWAGRKGFLYEAVLEDFADLHALTLYVSGSPAMVYATLDALVDKGLDPSQMHADVFEYAPRS